MCTLHTMAESKTFSFRASDDIAKRVEAQAKLAPRLAGEKLPSRHEMAKVLMVEALEARERKTRGKK